MQIRANFLHQTLFTFLLAKVLFQKQSSKLRQNFYYKENNFGRSLFYFLVTLWNSILINVCDLVETLLLVWPNANWISDKRRHSKQWQLNCCSDAFFVNVVSSVCRFNRKIQFAQIKIQIPLSVSKNDFVHYVRHC